MEVVLSRAWVAIALGAFTGTAMAAPIFLSVRILDSKRPELGVPVAMGASLGGLLLGLGVLLGYNFVAPDGFTGFALGTIVGFVVTTAVGAVIVYQRMYRSSGMES